MTTEDDAKPGRRPEPFRKPAQWGRPPATVFRAGPLPRGQNLPPLPPAPQAPASASPLSPSPAPRSAPRPQSDFFSGSMVPSRASASAPAPLAPSANLTGAATLAPVTPQPVPEPDFAIRPLPAAPAVESPVTPAPVSPTPTSAGPVAAAPSSVRTRSKPRPDRRPLVAIAAAVVAVVGIGGWWLTRSPAPVAATAVPETVPETGLVSNTVVETASTAPVTTEVPPAVTAATPTAAAPTVRRETPLPASAASRPTRPTPATSQPQPQLQAAAPTTQAAPQPQTPAPVVVVAPPPEAAPVPQGPSPTPAAPRSDDPDAPIRTLPQPLD